MQRIRRNTAAAKLAAVVVALQADPRFDVPAADRASRCVLDTAPDSEAVKAIADGGHEVLSHSYAMDVVPALLSDEDEKKK